ncbi:probable methyltransferase-like protein 24 isoform X2 [Biomphalaria glabrata]|uniref:Probable methyltransferase-like protein 24 isoform X2 n=1 Tax=Biomphalaria glabrata TaxID=6526 RepID=A0A9W2ZIH1_BIOGL|nr:probable methyltransferase-like protein 24 isoform X2 [Biomphalaria glabrata]
MTKAVFKMSSRRRIFVVLVMLILLSILYVSLSPYKEKQRTHSLNAFQDNNLQLRQIICHDTDTRLSAMSLPFSDDERTGITNELKREDKPDNSGAVMYLVNYTNMFSQNSSTPEADPNNASTVQTWWQAAAMIDWYYNGPVRYTCQHIKAVGNWHICQDFPYTVSPPCLVYSFGINYDFSFDNAMISLGCEVHSFDPSMKLETHKRGNNSAFYKWGISNVNSDAYQPRRDMYVKHEQTWKMRTLKSIIQELGHEKRVLDVLKLDVEAYEWGIVDNLIQTDVLKYVRQLMIEFHLFPNFPARSEYVYLYKTYTRLREMGFREYATWREPRNINERRFINQRAVDFVNYFFN